MVALTVCQTKHAETSSGIVAITARLDSLLPLLGAATLGATPLGGHRSALNDVRVLELGPHLTVAITAM